VIRLDHVTKVYEGLDHPAVDDLSLEVSEGQVCVLVGPSGCGKSTTLRMINLLIEADSGEIHVAGVDIRSRPPEELRRGIGYAIQGVGLFPHWTVSQNIGTVPWLLDWEKDRVAARVQELLELIGLDPARYAEAYPDELSGGEAQRVGVARALAADPPVLLMDEPFGAVDPITRERLQVEFLQLQSSLNKTVVFVTHDMEEAVKLGDRIAVMRKGRLVQYDRPERILAYPADDFVGGFVGEERALKRLSLATIVDVMGPAQEAEGCEYVIPVGATLRHALARILECGETDTVGVVNEQAELVGSVSLDDILDHFRRPLE
jgi:osmoprotectant transport system ATP-binding protein